MFKQHRSLFRDSTGNFILECLPLLPDGDKGFLLKATYFFDYIVLPGRIVTNALLVTPLLPLGAQCISSMKLGF